MDSVRFGRVLGIGTRLAAKTLVDAVDAAASPNPSAATPSKSTGQGQNPAQNQPQTRTAGVQIAQQVRQTGQQAQQASRGVKEGGKRFGRAVWRPMVKLSGVLWLELTGVFFGLFMVFAASAAWREHAALHATAVNHDAHVRFQWACAMAVVFGYFCVSSFVRAHLRGKRR